MQSVRGFSTSSLFFPVSISFLCGTLLGAFVWNSLRHAPAGLSFLPFTGRKNADIQDYVDDDERCDVPENAPDDCPGLESEQAGKASACSGCPNQEICASGEAKAQDPSFNEISAKMATIKKKILVLSGKGGVGKSTVSSQLSWLLQERGFDVGILDIDVCGPSIPMMTGSRGMDVHASADGWSPVYTEPNLAVMSVGFLLPEENDAVIWRGPKKNGLIKQFLTDVSWGHLDILIVDTPPGTSDEHLSIVTYLKEAGIDGVVVVSTPQEVALQDVRKEINFCKKVEVPILGLVENMTNSVFDIAHSGPHSAAQETCIQMGIPYSGRIPMDPDILLACETGMSLTKANPKSPALASLNQLVDVVLTSLSLPLLPTGSTTEDKDEGVLEVAP